MPIELADIVLIEISIHHTGHLNSSPELPGKRLNTYKGETVTVHMNAEDKV